MTDLLTTDHADSGEVVRLNLSIVDTDRLDLGERTRNLPTYARRLPPLHAIPRQQADETAELPTLRTIAVISDPLVVTGEIPRVRSEPVRVRPDDYRARHRRPRPLWAWRALLVGLGSVGTVAVELAGIAALAVWR